MKWWVIHLLLILLVTLVLAKKRDRVVIKGTTVRPGFTRREASKTVEECRAKHVALANYTKCCSTFLRTKDNNSCPQYTPNEPFIDYKDDAGCCSNLVPCSADLCKTPTRHKSTCPMTHNFAFDYGLKCCKFARRASGCTAGPGGSVLNLTDPSNCCHDNQFVKCVDSDGDDAVCNSFARASCPAPKVNFTDPIYNSLYPTTHVLTNQCEVVNVWNYMLWKDYQQNQIFILDLGCSRPIKTIQVRQTVDGCCRTPRGTKNFAVEMSEDTVTWTRLTQGMLNQYYWYTPCDQIPLVDFTTVDWVVGRYLKFIGIDHYAYSGGIQHLNWIYHA